MISKIELQNIFGITQKTILNLEIKHLKDSQLDYEQGIIVENNKKIMLSPTFISRNASGKTSILRAIEFAYGINSIDDICDTFLLKYNRFLQEKLSSVKRILDSSLSRMIRRNQLSARDSNYKKDFWFKIKSLLNGNDEEFEFNTQTQKFLKQILESFLSLYRQMFLDFENYEEALNFENESMQKAIKKIFDLQKSELIDGFHNSISSPKNLLYRNLSLVLEANQPPIYLRIVFSDQTEKTIEIGHQIKFNQKSLAFDTWKTNFINQILANEWWQEAHELIDSIMNFMNSKSTSASLIKAFKKFGTSLDKSHLYHKSSHKNQNSFLPKAIFIDDSMIRVKSKPIPISAHNFYPSINLGYSNFLEELVNFYSFDFVNKLIANLDSNVSHIEKQKNGGYALVDTSKRIKNFELLSFGTIKTLFLIHKMSKTFRKNTNNVILLDEIENGLNISLIKFIISVLNNPYVNKNNTQMIITTHSPSVFSRRIINIQSAFIFNKNFIRLGDDSSLIKRTEDLHKIFIPKNYYNPLFWENQTASDNLKLPSLDCIKTDSIGNFTIYNLMDLIEEKDVS